MERTERGINVTLMKRWIPRLIVLAVVAAGAAFLIIKKPWAKSAAPITYSTVQVSKGNIAAQVTANGTLSAKGTVQVGAQVSGRITELYVDFNDKVKKGQIIAKLDEQLLQAQITSTSASVALASANVNKAAVALSDADRQFKRQKTLQEQQLVAGATVEAAEVAYDTAKASLLAAKASAQQASAQLAQAKTNLSYATIISPVDGVVLSRAVEKGQTVQSSMTAPTLFTIAEDLAVMQIDTAVSEADVGLLKESMDAQFTVDAFAGRTFKGKVRQVRNAPTTTQGVVTYDAVIDVDNKDLELRPGMTANVTFVLAHVADAVKIPNSALRFKPTRDQMQALRGESGGSGGSGRGSGRRGRGSGSGGSGRGSDGSGSASPFAQSGGSSPGWMGGDGGVRVRDFGDKKPVWKLENGTPKMVLVKPGLTDGSTTEMVEGDLVPGDQLITEIQGVAKTNSRRTGPF